MARQLRGNRIPAGDQKRAAWWIYHGLGGSGGGGAVPDNAVRYNGNVVKYQNNTVTYKT